MKFGSEVPDTVEIHRYTLQKYGYTKNTDGQCKDYRFRVMVHSSIPESAFYEFVEATLREDLSYGAYPEYTEFVFDIARYWK